MNKPYPKDIIAQHMFIAELKYALPAKKEE
jgi:hypothetical protein